MRGFFTETPPMVVHEYLRERIGLPWSTDFRAFARVVDGRIIGAVGYEGFNGCSCRMHMAGEFGWMNRETIQKAFRYPFFILDLPMVFGIVPSGNTAALEIDRKFGFTQLLYVPGAHADGGLHFLQLTRENWLRTKHGKQSARSA